MSSAGAGDGVRDDVVLVASDPSWAAQFEKEARAIRHALGPLGDAFGIEHVGSTAIRGLAAKPIIDVLLVPPDRCWPRAAVIDALRTLGYVWWDANPDPAHLFFVKGMPPFGTGRTHHVHVHDRAAAERVIAFRDRLRASPALAAEYEELKRRLAVAFPTDREAYTRGKDGFVARVLAGARSERA